MRNDTRAGVDGENWPETRNSIWKHSTGSEKVKGISVNTLQSSRLLRVLEEEGKANADYRQRIQSPTAPTAVKGRPSPSHVIADVELALANRRQSTGSTNKWTWKSPRTTGSEKSADEYHRTPEGGQEKLFISFCIGTPRGLFCRGARRASIPNGKSPPVPGSGPRRKYPARLRRCRTRPSPTRCKNKNRLWSSACGACWPAWTATGRRPSWRASPSSPSTTTTLTRRYGDRRHATRTRAASRSVGAFARAVRERPGSRRLWGACASAPCSCPRWTVCWLAGSEAPPPNRQRVAPSRRSAFSTVLRARRRKAETTCVPMTTTPLLPESRRWSGESGPGQGRRRSTGRLRRCSERRLAAAPLLVGRRRSNRVLSEYLRLRKQCDPVTSHGDAYVWCTGAWGTDVGVCEN